MLSNEYIYDLLPKKLAPVPSKVRYVSKYSNNIKTEKQANKYAHKTMGPAKLDLKPATEYLKKHANDFIFPEKRNFIYRDIKKPPIPKANDQQKTTQNIRKDYIKANVADVVTAVPRQVNKIYVDTVYGHKNLLELSGLEPMYVNKKDYGQTPVYLKNRTENNERLKKERKLSAQLKADQESMKLLPKEEQESILEGLKQNWEDTYRQYLGLSVIIDTIPKQIRKERLEKELDVLQRDIELFSRFKTLYVAD